MFNNRSIILLGALTIAPHAKSDLSADLAAAVDAPYLTFTTGRHCAVVCGYDHQR